MTFNDLDFQAHPSREGGVRAVHTFANGYGVSVIKTPYSYGGGDGLYELAVLGPDGRIDYTTPVTEDVEGHLTAEGVSKLLAQVAALPAKIDGDEA
jgi:hypothetical protein